MYVLSRELRIRVIHALCEGNSVNATSRMTGAGKPTILRLLLRVGLGCERLHNRIVRGVQSALIQCDEAWSYIFKKESRVTPSDPAEYGDAYVFVALDANSRLIVSYLAGKRNAESTREFIEDLRRRVAVIPQISTDGFAPYVDSLLNGGFNGAVDYAQCVKNYRRGARRDDDHRYEPPRSPFITKTVIAGAPDPKHIGTSLVENQNRTIRIHVRRMTRLADAFSKKLENHRAALALHFAFFNFVRIHETLKTAPAVAAGLLARPWTIGELLDAALDEPHAALPEPMPLAPREGMGTARELPGGRGWLRVVRTGDAPAPTQPAPAAKLTEAPPAKDERQGDLFTWAASKPAEPPKPLLPMGTQLNLFDP